MGDLFLMAAAVAAVIMVIAQVQLFAIRRDLAKLLEVQLKANVTAGLLRVKEGDPVEGHSQEA